MDKSLYQIYRPSTFKDVIGQSAVVDVLESASSKKDIPQAYLFTGSRGIGKTSLARIFAKKIGCSEIDIFEIDAASNTSVENIRELTASIYTQPSSSKYKLYILDEVHMLSKSAFNAFLKTLEEPPAHSIFILITTEVDKIPDTIISRCINLHFKQPTILELEKAVAKIAKEEEYKLEKRHLAIIALSAEGSFRDAMTNLQKIFLVSKTKEIKDKDIEAVLNIPKSSLVNNYIDALISGDKKNGLEVLRECDENNINMTIFAKLVIRKIRSAILLKSNVSYIFDELLKEDQDFVEKIKNEECLFTLLNSMIEIIHSLPKTYIKILPFEMLLIR